MALSGQPFHRLPLPLRVVAFDIVENLRLQGGKCPMDSFLAELWLCREFYHLIPLDLAPAKSYVGFDLTSVPSARAVFNWLWNSEGVESWHERLFP